MENISKKTDEVRNKFYGLCSALNIIKEHVEHAGTRTMLDHITSRMISTIYDLDKIKKEVSDE